MRRRLFFLAAVGSILACTVPTAAYLKLGLELLDGRIVSARWTNQPVRYFVTNRDASVTAPQLQAAAQRAFETWTKVPTATLAAEFAGFTGADPFVADGATVIGFRSRPDLDRTLGATRFEYDHVTGRLMEADIFVNSASAFPWSIADAGETGRYDLQSILTHEIGHLFGLGHSALGETELQPGGGRRVLGKRAVMFPIAFPPGNILDRTLQDDDIAGMSDIYPTPTFNQKTGAVSGRVTLNGRGLLGAHVAALDPNTGVLIGGFALDDQGQFVIAGLNPGVYIVRAEPLDDASLDSFVPETVMVNLNFRPTYFPRLVPVPAGGSSASIEIKVQAK